MNVQVVNCHISRRCLPRGLREGDQIAYLHGHDGDWDIYQAGTDPASGALTLHRIPDGEVGPPKGPDAWVVLPNREQVRSQRND